MIDILPVKSDNLLHDLLNKENIKFIEWIVMTIYNLSYEEIKGKCKMENIRLTRTHSNDRNKYVDFMIKFKDNILILELNNNYLGSSIRNIVYGMTEIVNSYQKEKNKYYDKVITLTLINLNWYKNKKDSINKERIKEIYCLDDEEKGLFFKVIDINLDKYASINYNEIVSNEKLYKLLTINKKSELLDFSKNDLLLDVYVKKIIKLSKSKKYKEEIMTETMEENLRNVEIYQYAKREGISQGVEQNQMDIIKNMYQKKFDLNVISEVLNIPISKVKRIIKKINN